MFNKSSIFLLATFFFLLTGCTKENLEDCFASLKLKFTFTLHTNEEGNRFGPDVQIVKVYFFDEQGILTHIQEEKGAALTNDYAMDVQIAPGNYTIVAWGGSQDDFYNSFHEGHMNDPQTHDYENGITIGKTTLSDFRVFLNYGIADDYPEDIMPTIDEFDDLYYGAAGTRQSETSKYLFGKVEVRTGKANEKSIELIRNTNILKVTITGISHLRNYYRRATGIAGPEILKVWVSARNGRYKFDNSIGEYARMMRYPPIYRNVDDDSMVIDIKTMRLDMAKHRAEPMYLTILNPITNMTYPPQPIDVVNTLLQARDPKTGEYIYKSQEDFDKIYEHPFRIEISADLSIRIIVHEWEIIMVRPEI